MVSNEHFDQNNNACNRVKAFCQETFPDQNGGYLSESIDV